MEIKIAISLLVKYLAPIVTKIIKSKISAIGKTLYEKLYNRIVDALQSFEKALTKCLKTDDVKKLKKNIVCCSLGLKFFTKIYEVLEGVLPEYEAAIEEAKNRYNNLTGEEVKCDED